jgi:hypothetical protein
LFRFVTGAEVAAPRLARRLSAQLRLPRETQSGGAAAFP